MGNKSKMNAELVNEAAVYVEGVTFLAEKEEKEWMERAVYEALEWGRRSSKPAEKSSSLSEDEEEFMDWERLEELLHELRLEAIGYCYRHR